MYKILNEINQCLKKQMIYGVKVSFKNIRFWHLINDFLSWCWYINYLLTQRLNVSNVTYWCQLLSSLALDIRIGSYVHGQCLAIRLDDCIVHHPRINDGGKCFKVKWPRPRYAMTFEYCWLTNRYISYSCDFWIVWQSWKLNCNKCKCWNEDKIFKKWVLYTLAKIIINSIKYCRIISKQKTKCSLIVQRYVNVMIVSLILVVNVLPGSS